MPTQSIFSGLVTHGPNSARSSATKNPGVLRASATLTSSVSPLSPRRTRSSIVVGAGGESGLAPGPAPCASADSGAGAPAASATTPAAPVFFKKILRCSSITCFLQVRPRSSRVRGRGLLGREIELHLGAAWIVAENLPRSHTHLPAERELYPAGLEPRHRALQVGGAEREMVQHPGRVRGHLPLGDMQDGLAARVQPRAVETERGPRSLGEAENPDVERPRRRELVGEHVEVIHSLDRHEASCAMSSDRMRFTPAFSIFSHAAASEPCMSIARQASSTTSAAKPSLRASSAVHATQKSVASPQTNTRLTPRSSR